MPSPDAINAATDQALRSIEAKLDTAEFRPSAARIRAEWLRLIQAGRDFRESGHGASPDLLASAEAARDAAAGMRPDRASIDAACQQFARLSTRLEQASGTAAVSGGPEAKANWLRGALRIGPGGATPGTRSRDGGAAAGGDPNYYQKLTNLFPAEALALYGTGVALFGEATPFVVIAALVVLLILRALATEPAGGGSPHWLAVIVAAASFLLWATATDPAWLAWATVPDENLRRMAAFLGAALVVLAPLVVKAPAPASPAH